MQPFFLLAPTVGLPRSGGGCVMTLLRRAAAELWRRGPARPSRCVVPGCNPSPPPHSVTGPRFWPGGTGEGSGPGPVPPPCSFRSLTQCLLTHSAPARLLPGAFAALVSSLMWKACLSCWRISEGLRIIGTEPKPAFSPGQQAASRHSREVRWPAGPTAPAPGKPALPSPAGFSAHSLCPHTSPSSRLRGPLSLEGLLTS